MSDLDDRPVARHGEWPLYPPVETEEEDLYSLVAGPLVFRDCPRRCCEGCSCEPGTCLCDGNACVCDTEQEDQ